jgi:hypothetical protein
MGGEQPAQMMRADASEQPRPTLSKPAKLQEFLPRSIPMMKMDIGLFLSI